MRKWLLRFAKMVLVLMLIAGSCIAEDTVPDYSNTDNWAYYGIGEDRNADLFLICRTVDMGTNGNYNMAMDDSGT